MISYSRASPEGVINRDKRRSRWKVIYKRGRDLIQEARLVLALLFSFLRVDHFVFMLLKRE